MIRLGKTSLLGLLLGLGLALGLPCQVLADDVNDFSVVIAFQPGGTGTSPIITDKFTVNDVTHAITTSFDALPAGITDTVRSSFAVSFSPTKITVTYGGTFTSNGGANVWTISKGSATSNFPAGNPNLGVLTFDYGVTHSGKFSSALTTTVIDDFFSGHKPPVTLPKTLEGEGTLTEGAIPGVTGLRGTFGGAFSGNPGTGGTTFSWHDLAFSGPGTVTAGPKSFMPGSHYGIQESVELDSNPLLANQGGNISDLSVASVPEPTTMLLGVIGVLGAAGGGVWRRWKRTSTGDLS
jgi:hypothetical protein